MPAATSKSELTRVCEAEYEKLRRVLDAVPIERASDVDDDDTSVRDIVVHRAHWIDLFLGWYRDGLAGEDVHFPAPGYKWNELKRYNADLRARTSHIGWRQALDDIDAAHARLLSFIEARTDDELYGGPMQGARNAWTPGRWAEAAGPSHYRSAAKYVRRRIRESS